MSRFWKEGFFDDAFTVPDDAREISDDLYDALMTGQAAGRQIVTGPDGLPMLVDPPSPGAERLASDARLARNALLQASDWTQLPDAPVLPGAWASYRVDLRNVPEQAGFPNVIDWPQAPA